MRRPFGKATFLVVLIVGLLLTIGCVTTTTNLTPAGLQYEPSIQSYKDPAFKADTHRTFSVFPSSLINNDVQLKGGILEKQMLFVLRNAFERRSYKFVELDQSPDLLVTIDASAPYYEEYVPPRTVTIPSWVPGQTVRTYGHSSGTFDYNTYGNYSSYGWGTYTGSSTSTTYVPGYMTTQTYTRSGYTTGAYYPSITVAIFDGKTLQNIWLGEGVGTSPNPDVRVSSQGVLMRLLEQFPVSVLAKEILPTDSGMIGIWCSVLTNDGNNYFPTVMNVAPGSPASKAGIKLHDMILTIDGVSTQNKSFSETMALVSGDAGTKVSMTLWRVNKQINVSMVRIQRP